MPTNRRTLLTAAAAALAAPAAPAARAQAWPSRPLKIVVPFGAGGPADLYARTLAQALQDSLGQPCVHVPYKNSGAARSDVMSGQVDFMFDALPGMASTIRGAKVQALATAGRSRSAAFPDLPTVHESGVPDFETIIWNGIMAPRGTPAAAIARLNAEIQRIVALPDVARGWAEQGTIAMRMGAAEFDAYVEADVAKWARVIKLANVTI